MPECFGKQYDKYDVEMSNLDRFLDMIAHEEQNRELSKQEVIVLALKRLSVLSNGLYYHIDSFFSEDRREELGEWDDICEFNPGVPHAEFLERVARSVNALSITVFFTICRLDAAVRQRTVGTDAPGSK